MDPQESDCYRCGRICLAFLRNGGTARTNEIAERTGYSAKMISVHIRHLLDSKQLQVAGDGRWKLTGNGAAE